MDTTAQLQSPAPADDLEKMPVEQVLRKLMVKTDAGLSTAEAAQRLSKYGPNALVEKEVSWARKILGPFTGPIAYMIEAASRPSCTAGRISSSSPSCCCSMPDSNCGRISKHRMPWQP
jgi:magnesium-transporting ATPase (P-type)